jgi:Flp pilus assembly protein TadB
MILRYYRSVSRERIEKEHRSTRTLMVLSVFQFVAVVLSNSSLGIAILSFLFTVCVALWFVIVRREFTRRRRDDSTYGPQHSV